MSFWKRTQAAIVWTGLLLALPLQAATLKRVQVTDGSQVDLFFDARIKPSQIHTDFVKDIIQFSLDGVNVYPAKISSVSGSDLTKVFAYQYAPKLVRCRLTVNGPADKYAKRVQFKTIGKILSIRILPASGGEGEGARGSSEVTRDESPAARGSNEIVNIDERALLDRVMHSQAAPARPESAAAAPAAQPEQARAAKTAPAAAAVASESRAQAAPEARAPIDPESLPIGRGRSAASRTPDEQLAGAKPLPSPLRSFFWLGVTLAIFGLCALIAKKLRGEGAQASNEKGLTGALGRFARNTLKRNGKMIEVVATHYLGPKKSIAVVRVQGKLLVLGVTNESVNLITQMADGANDVASAFSLSELAELESLESDQAAKGAGIGAMPGSGATAAGPAFFADLLNQERGKPSLNLGGAGASAAITPRGPGPTITAGMQPGPAPLGTGQRASARAQIRSRLEGLKPL